MDGNRNIPRGTRLFAVLVIAASYLVISVTQILTKRPWVDEAWFTGPALDLTSRRMFGTLLLDPNGSHLRLFNPDAVLYGIDRFTYWVMPLHLVQLAAWGRIFGFSIFAMRIPSLLWGGIAIYCTGVIVRRLFGGGIAPLAAMLVLAVDFGFTMSAADARMDMTCAALGLAAIAVYLSLRQRTFGRAVVLSHTLAASSLFTHPNGLFSSLALLVLMVLMDRERITSRRLLGGVIPYLALGGIWLFFCLKDPVAWHAQLAANAADRGSGLRAPWAGVWREVNGRFRNHFWPDGTAGKFKIVGLLLYLGSLVLLATAPHLRKNPGCRLILLLTALQFLFLSIFASMKAPYYMVHILPYFACAAGIALAYGWEKGSGFRGVSIVAVVIYAGVQIATPVHLAFVVNGYRQEFVPLITYLKSEMRADDLVCGSAELGFGLGFYNKQLIDDVWVGHWSGKRPTLLVLDRWYYDEVMRTADQRAIPYKGYFGELLSQFQLVKTLRGYRVYRRERKR